MRQLVKDAKQILLIEDHLGDARLLQEALKDTGANYTVTICRRLDDAVHLYRKQNFDLAILDLNLPDATWQDTLMHLKKSFLEIPVIVITGIDDQGIALQVIRAGAQDYLPKGFYDVELLTRTIHHAMERFELLNELKNARDQERLLAHYDVLTKLPTAVYSKNILIKQYIRLIVIMKFWPCYLLTWIDSSLLMIP